jgi:hypothetical protein
MQAAGCTGAATQKAWLHTRQRDDYPVSVWPGGDSLLCEHPVRNVNFLRSVGLLHIGDFSRNVNFLRSVGLLHIGDFSSIGGVLRP